MPVKWLFVHGKHEMHRGFSESNIYRIVAWFIKKLKRHKDFTVDHYETVY